MHFGATLGTSIRLLTKNVLSTDVFIGCGTAAAISAGFNAPIAGLIFAHEALLRHFSIKAVTPIAISSFTAAAVADKFFGGEQVFVTEVMEMDLINFIPIAILGGIFFGFIALTYMQSLNNGPQIFAKTKLTTKNFSIKKLHRKLFNRKIFIDRNFHRGYINHPHG